MSSKESRIAVKNIKMIINSSNNNIIVSFVVVLKTRLCSYPILRGIKVSVALFVHSGPILPSNNTYITKILCDLII